MPRVLLTQMSGPRQTWEVVGGPLVSGVLTGVLLGTTWWLYVASVLVALIGGIGVGGQHVRPLAAVARGLWSGLLWGLAVLGAHAVIGGEAAVALPDPQLGYLAYTIVPATISTSISWYVLTRRERPAPAHAA